MPFASEKQKRYLWAKKPEVAREFAAKEKKMPSKAQLTTKAVSEAVKRAPMHMPNQVSKSYVGKGVFKPISKAAAEKPLGVLAGNLARKADAAAVRSMVSRALAEPWRPGSRQAKEALIADSKTAQRAAEKYEGLADRAYKLHEAKRRRLKGGGVEPVRISNAQPGIYRGVRKSFQPAPGRIEMPNQISKMSPDPSEVHVPGALRTRRPKGRLKKVTTSGM